MQVTMQHAEHLTLAQMREFLSASSSLSFAGAGRRQIYALIERVLRTQNYLGLTNEGQRNRAPLSRQDQRTQRGPNQPLDRPLARLRRHPAASLAAPPLPNPLQARRYPAAGQSRWRPRRPLRPGRAPHLAARIRGPRPGPYERLAAISASHIYNPRRSRTYREQRLHHTKTRASAVNIGERRKPEPRGQPGHLRVDTVQQGDTPKGKGLYHINAVETVTQWQIVGCCETISEAYLLPVLEAMLHQFPFQIRGFHSDNGSEFLNYKVRKLLNKLLVKFTKSRANRTTDNALVEGKNGAVVRKHIGHAPIASHHAGQVQRFYTADFNPYLNYHRPCGFATIEVKDNGKRRRHYRPNDYCTPYEKLVSLEGWEDHLKTGITAAYLEQQARQMSDTECALRMQQRKTTLLDACRTRL